MVIDLERYAGPAGAAKALGLTPQRVIQLIAEGRLRAVMTPNGRLIDMASVEEEKQRRESERSVPA